jgi:hypothetical protein
MVELRQGSRLAREACDGVGVNGEVRGEHFQSDGAPGVVLERFVDFAHASLTQKAEDLEVSQVLMGAEHERRPRIRWWQVASWLGEKHGKRSLAVTGWR